MRRVPAQTPTLTWDAVSYTHLVTVTVDEAAHTVAVKGPKGSLNSNYHPLMTVKVEGNEVLVLSLIHI